MAMHRVLSVLLGGCLLLGMATTARAGPAAPAVRARPAVPAARRAIKRIGVVLLLEKTDPKAAAAVVQAIRSQLADTPVRLELKTEERFAAELSGQLALARRTASAKRANVVIWFSVSRPEPLYLYFVEKQGIRLIMRSFGDMEPDERAEAAAIVVRSSVLAFLRGQRVGRKIAGPKPKVNKPPPVVHPPPAQPTRRKIWTSLELGYTYAYDDWDASLTGQHGLEARVALHLRPRWSLLLGYQWSQPAPLSDSAGITEVQLRLHRLLAGARFRHPFGRWHLGATLILNADYVDYEVRRDAMVLDLDERPLFLWSVTASLHVGLRLVNRLRLQLDVGAEVGIYSPTLRLRTPGLANEYSKFGKPEVVRPRVLLALAVDLW